jgi:Trk K+ transport system NAD-binding subunit
VCELAKRHKSIKRIIARIVDKGDEVIFRDLGVSDVVWEVDGIVGRIISSLYRMDIIEVEDDVLIVSLRISQNDKSVGKKIRELRLPRRGTLLLGIVRLGQWMIPTGEDVVEEGDSVFFLLRRKNLNKVYSQFF